MRCNDQGGWSRQVGRRCRFPPDGFQAKDVTCPSGVGAEVGVEFDCKFTGPEGTEYSAHMKVTKVDGENVELYVASKPS